MIDSNRRNFDKLYINNELNNLNKTLSEKINIYLLGGAIMAMKDLKSGTKDIDVIVTDNITHQILVNALKKCNYYLLQSQDLSKPYNQLSATALQNNCGFLWEIFIEYIAKKLALSDNMKSRATKIYCGKNLNVFGLSNEDIFLMKSMTERDRDLDDMMLIVRTGIDYGII